jgi:hypothetical protein
LQDLPLDNFLVGFAKLAACRHTILKERLTPDILAGAEDRRCPENVAEVRRPHGIFDG